MKYHPGKYREGYYGTGNFNSVKWHADTKISVIEETGLKKLLEYTFRTFKASKMYSLQGFLQLTGMIWQLDGDLNWGIDAEAFLATEKEESVPDTAEQGKVKLLLKNWMSLINQSILKYPMNYIGWGNLALISLALTSIKRKENWKNALHAFPLLCYNFGTALLLTGFDWRFFYLNFPLIIPTIFLLIKPGEIKL